MTKLLEIYRFFQQNKNRRSINIYFNVHTAFKQYIENVASRFLVKGVFICIFYNWECMMHTHYSGKIQKQNWRTSSQLRLLCTVTVPEICYLHILQLDKRNSIGYLDTLWVICRVGSCKIFWCLQTVESFISSRMEGFATGNMFPETVEKVYQESDKWVFCNGNLGSPAPCYHRNCQ